MGIGVVVAIPVTWFASRQNSSASSISWSGKVGIAPLIPTMCRTQFTNSQSIAVLVEVDGKPYAMIPDTGSSNFNLASSHCGAECDVHPQWPSPNPSHGRKPTFNVVYGTGGILIGQEYAKLSLGGVGVTNGSFGAILQQYAGADGFNMFPPKSDQVCHNTYAGVLGLAYRGQAAGPVGNASNKTTNGTVMTLLDQLTAGAEMPNAFAIEMCNRYPEPCGPRKNLQTWAPSRPCDTNSSLGNFYLGGYRSSSLESEMQFTRISDEIH